MPIEVSDSEVLIRTVTTWNVNARGKLKPSLFHHPEDRVSVARRNWIPPWLAKAYAKARIQNATLKPPKLYLGLAFVSAGNVRKNGSDVIDSREEYLGHADIRNGIVQSRQEALPPEQRKQLDERARAIAKSARFVKDPNPKSILWSASEREID